MTILYYYMAGSVCHFIYQWKTFKKWVIVDNISGMRDLLIMHSGAECLTKEQFEAECKECT